MNVFVVMALEILCLRIYFYYLIQPYWLVEPNELEARFLLSEIIQSGNFGQYDKRLVGLGQLNYLNRILNSLL